MNGSDLRFEKDGLTIVVSTTPAEARVIWTGVSDSRDPSTFLSPAVDRIVKSSSGLKVTIDLSGMDFMNSSTISSLVGLVKTLNGTSPEVVVVFADSDWQRVHMRCMRTITRVLQHVTVEGRQSPITN